MQREIFGPVLHVATFNAQEIDRIIVDINASGYGLTFGLHTRIDDRVEHFTKPQCRQHLREPQPDRRRRRVPALRRRGPVRHRPEGGRPHYVRRFSRPATRPERPVASDEAVDVETVQRALDRLPGPARRALSILEMPGPTGESNVLSLYPRGRVLCLGPAPEDALEQARLASAAGCPALIVCPGVDREGAIAGYLCREDLASLSGFAVVALWSEASDLATARVALAKRDGPLVQLVTDRDIADRCVLERHVCVDTTASGGNASLLAAAAR